MKKILSFDIELSSIVTTAELLTVPLDISVAATVSGEERHIFFTTIDDIVQNKLSKHDAFAFLNFLKTRQDNGYIICAWNGLQFDLKVIGQTAHNIPLATSIALASYDPMFQFFNLKGFPIGLAATAKGFYIEQEKTISGADAPQLWLDGEYNKVKEYVLGDCELTNKIMTKIIRHHEIAWITKNGRRQVQRLRKLLTVSEVILEPFTADQSWIGKPLKKENFYSWMDKTQLRERK